MSVSGRLLCRGCLPRVPGVPTGMERLTPEQVHILNQLANGEVPSAMDPKRSFAALERRGLAMQEMGSYRNTPGVQHLVWRLTAAGLEALKDEAQRRHDGAVRKAKSDLNKTLRRLSGVRVGGNE